MFGSSSWRKRLGALVGQAKAEPFSRPELEALLFEADLAPALVQRLLRVAETAWAEDRNAVLSQLQGEVVKILLEMERPAKPLPRPGGVLLLGVNGSGKTTMAAKLAQYWKAQGQKVLLAAADTFRAGAIEQLKLWGERLGVEVIAQKTGADPAAVVFDAWQRAIAQDAILVADSAGRMHTKQPLVDELKKIVRVWGKDGRDAPHERYLVLDGTVGQNALAQSREFLQAAAVTGLIVTKLDGTARGGAVLSSSVELELPIRFVGVGEKPEDVRVFTPSWFAKELLSP